MPWSLYYCLFAPLYGCCSLHASRLWWIAHSTQRQQRDCNNIPSFWQWTVPINDCTSFLWRLQLARHKMVLWPGPCEALTTKNMRSVRFVVKRRGCSCCCNLSGGVALNVLFTTNWLCAKIKNNNIYMWCKQAIIREIATHDLYCCLLPRCEALRTYRSGFSDRNTTNNYLNVQCNYSSKTRVLLLLLGYC